MKNLAQLPTQKKDHPLVFISSGYKFYLRVLVIVYIVLVGVSYCIFVVPASTAADAFLSSTIATNLFVVLLFISLNRYYKPTYTKGWKPIPINVTLGLLY